MAIDLSKHADKTSPDGIASIGTPTRDAWLPAGEDDWSRFSFNAADAQSKGLTRKVAVSRAILNDGREVYVVRDASGQPILTQSLGDPTGTDPDQQRSWDARKPPGGATTRTINGQVFQWNPDTRAYDTPTGQASATAKPTNVYIGRNPKTGKPSQISEYPDGHVEYDDTQVPASAVEGGPPGGKPFIDDGPDAGPHGRRWGWNPQTRAFDRDLGPSPAAQKPTSASERKPHPSKPGIYIVTTTDATTGKTESHFEDKDGNRVELPDNPDETTRTITRNGTTYIEHTVKKPDGTSETFHTDQAGNRVTLPNETKRRAIPKGAPRFVPDFEQDDLGLTDFDDALRDAVEAGLLDADQAAELMEEAGTRATVADRRRQAQQGRLLTQRQQDLTEVDRRRDAAGRVYDTAYKDYSSYGGKLPQGSGGVAADAFLAALNLGQQNAERWGGMREVAPTEIPQPLQAIRDIKIKPDGSVSISMPDPTPNTPLTAEDRAQQAAAARGATAPGRAGGSAAPVVNPTTAAPNTAASMARPTPADGNERPDDILTVQGQQGVPIGMTRTEYDGLAPAVRGSVVVTNARPNPNRPDLQPRPSTSDPATTDPNDPINQHPGGGRVLPAPQPYYPGTDDQGRPSSFVPGQGEPEPYLRAAQRTYTVSPEARAELRAQGYEDEEIDRVAAGMA